MVFFLLYLCVIYETEIFWNISLPTIGNSIQNPFCLYAQMSDLCLLIISWSKYCFMVF